MRANFLLKTDFKEADRGRKNSMKRPGKIARFKIQRRLGVELPGLGKAGALERRPYPPGENGNKRRKYSDFALRLEEKQKVRCHYELREEHLRRFIRQSIFICNRIIRKQDERCYKQELSHWFSPNGPVFNILGS